MNDVELPMEKIEGEELILVEILSRLPVKALVCLKCVSKRWRSLISDPHVAKSQLRRSLDKCPNACHRILITDPLHAVDYNGDRVRRRLQHPHIFEQPIEFAGSCNGLVCLVNMPDTFAVFNPTTGETRELPKPTCIRSHCTFFKGFGYDSSTDDYKLVRGPCPTLGPQPDFIVEIFSLRANSWKRIEYSPDLGVVDGGIFLNGSVHWLLTTSHGDNHYEKRIVSLDLSDEKFRMVMPLPDVAPRVTFNGLNIIEGCLSTFSGGSTFNAEVEPVDVWIMREYGVKSSWTKLCSFTPRELPKTWFLVNLLCFRGDGKVIFNVGGSHLVVYDAHDDSCDVIHPKPGMSTDYFDTVIYVESLVSPHKF